MMDIFKRPGWLGAVVLLAFAPCLPPAIFAQEGGAAALPAPRVFAVRDYGAVPGSASDAGPAIRSAIAAAMASGAPSEVVLEGGAYRIGAESAPGSWWKKAALSIRGAKNLTLRGTRETTLLVTDPDSSALFVSGSENVSIRDLAVDFDPVPFTQGTVTAVHPEENTFEVKLDDGFLDYGDAPVPKGGGLGILAWPNPLAEGERVYHVYVIPMTPVAQTGPRQWKMQCPPGFKWANMPNLKPGCPIVDRNRVKGGGAALFLLNCRKAQIEKVSVYAASGFAIFPQGCDDVTVRDCTVGIRPGSGRIFSTNADGLHVGENRRIVIEGCSFSGMGDDAINLESEAIVPLQRLSPSEFVFRPLAYAVSPGDVIEAVRPDTEEIAGRFTVKEAALQADGYHIAFEQPLPEIQLGKGMQWSDHSGDQFYNLNQANNGFVIRNNTFGPHRGREILAEACGGLIEGNLFRNSGESVAIGMSYEPGADAEGPIGRQVVISGNRFLGRGGGNNVIWIGDRLRSQAPASQMIDRDIRIEDNNFEGLTQTAVNAKYGRGLVIRNNRVVAGARAAVPAPRLPSAFVVTGSPDAVVSGNQVDDPAFLKPVQINP